MSECHEKECHCHEHEHCESHEHRECHREHGHEHREHSCSCDGHHGHHHDHGGHCHEGCACQGGRDESELKREFIICGVAVLLFAISFLPVFQELRFSQWICLAAALLAGRETLKEGCEDLLHFHFGEETLMSIAVVAAFLIGEYVEGTMVALLFTFGENLEGLAVDRSKKNIAALADIRPDSANVVVGDETESRPAAEVEIGTEIIVKVGERVPLDCEVLGEGVMADASALTGESMPVNVETGEILKAGCIVLGSPAHCKTVSGYGDSAAARIIEMVESASEKKGATEKFITRFSEIYTPIVCALAALIFIVPWVFNWLPFTESSHRALVFLVSSCPCALVLSIPLAYFAGIGSASKHGVIIKGSEYCERLANVKNAVFDKTGTLTSGKLRVAKIEVTGNYPEEEILEYAASAEFLSDHPIAKCVVAEAEGRGLDFPKADRVNEIAGEGVTVNFGEKTVVCGNKKLLSRQGIRLEKEEGANLYIAVNGELAGSIFLEDTVREEATQALKKLRELGVEKIHMLTGDNPKAAEKVAGICGVDTVHASLLPEGKVCEIEEIKKSGVTVFTGDGINDAPVLAAADIGTAMGMGTDAAIESADIVLMKGGIGALPKAVAIAKKIMICVKQNVIFIMGVKVVVLILGALGYAPIWLAVFADVGVCLLTVLWSLRLLKVKI